MSKPCSYDNRAIQPRVSKDYFTDLIYNGWSKEPWSKCMLVVEKGVIAREQAKMYL